MLIAGYANTHPSVSAGRTPVHRISGYIIHECVSLFQTKQRLAHVKFTMQPVNGTIRPVETSWTYGVKFGRACTYIYIWYIGFFRGNWISISRSIRIYLGRGSINIWFHSVAYKLSDFPRIILFFSFFFFISNCWIIRRLEILNWHKNLILAKLNDYKS